MMRWLSPVLWLLFACRDTYVLRGLEQGNAQPLAQAGTGLTVRHGTTVTVDGSGSFDPDGEIEAYTWTLIGVPTGSAAVLSSRNMSSSSFVADVPGMYLVELVVRDDAGGIAFDQVTFEVPQIPPTLVTANAGTDTTIGWFTRGQVTGSVSATDGFTPTFSWTMTGRPFYSTATLTNSSTLTPSFVADVQGTYTLELAATADGVTVTDDVNVTASTVGQSFGAPDFDPPLAIAYSTALDRLIVVRGYPVAVSVIDPATGLGPTVVLPVAFQYTPHLVLDPSGLRAAVGVPYEIAIVDLQTLLVERVLDFPYNTFYRLVFGSDNRIHSVPEYAGKNTIITVDVATGALTEAAPFCDFPGVAIHTAGAAMYLVDGAASTIARYDIASTPIALQRQATAPVLSAPLYITSDGASIITGSGVVLRSSASAATDMTVRGSLMTTNIEAVAHSSVTHEIATLSSSTSSQRVLSWFNDATFVRRFSAAFNDPITLNPYASAFIAYRADGQRVYIVGERNGEWTVFTVAPPP